MAQAGGPAEYTECGLWQAKDLVVDGTRIESRTTAVVGTYRIGAGGSALIDTPSLRCTELYSPEWGWVLPL